MQQDQKKALPNGNLVFCLLALNAIVMEQGLIANSGWYMLLLFTVPLLVGSVINFYRRQP